MLPRTTITNASGAANGDATPAVRELVSVVVITYNRAGPLLDALQSVGQMDLDDEFDTEIVVVDNASTDDTAGVVADFASACPLPVRQVIEPRAGTPFARNRGVCEARGDWIGFFDDDQTAEPGWLRALYRAAKTRGALCAGGPRDLVVEGGVPAPDSVVGRRLLGESPPNASAGDYHRKWLPNTGNVLIHRSVFDAIGGFNEETLEGGEDTDFFHRLLKSGRQAIFTPDALVHHHIPAGRVSDDYLQWVAIRHGVVMGRRDLSDGWGRLAWSLVARSGQAALVLAPLWALHRLRGDRAKALGELCRLRRFQGFTKYVVHRLTPRSLRGPTALGKFHHRNSRTPSAGANPEPKQVTT